MKRQRPRKTLRDIKLLPWFVVDSVNFMFRLSPLRFIDRLRLLALVYIRWALFFYVPFDVWLVWSLLSEYFSVPASFFAKISPVWLGVLPLPYFESLAGAFLTSFLCLAFAVAWSIIGLGLLNLSIEKLVKSESLEEKWKRSCLAVGLTPKVSLDESGNEIHDWPPIVSATDKYFVVEGRGITVRQIREKQFELSSGMTLFLTNIEQTKDTDGRLFPHLVTLHYSARDLPAMIPFESVPMNEQAIFGLSHSGWESIPESEWPHILIVGTTGAGKSIGLRSLLTQLQVTRPGSLFIGVDLKGGSELNVFARAGRNFHLCVDHHNTIDALEIVFAEYKRRVARLAHSLADVVDDLPIYICIDEAAELFDKKGVDKPTFEKVVSLVDKLSRLARAANIRLIVATQKAQVTSSNMPATTKSMLQTRILLRVEQAEDSISVVGSAIGAKIPDLPGRAILHKGQMQREIQIPYLSKEQTQSILSSLPFVENELNGQLSRFRKLSIAA